MPIFFGSLYSLGGLRTFYEILLDNLIYRDNLLPPFKSNIYGTLFLMQQISINSQDILRIQQIPAKITRGSPKKHETWNRSGDFKRHFRRNEKSFSSNKYVKN